MSDEPRKGRQTAQKQEFTFFSYQKRKKSVDNPIYKWDIDRSGSLTIRENGRGLKAG